MSPKVTVLMAVKEGEDYVAEAIESVFAQTLSDFEFLVVDDGSRDRTPAILESYSDARLRVLRHETNRGEAPSRNRALREARGDYVAILDHDDACRPDRLEREAAVLDAEPAVAVVGSWATVVVDDGHGVGHVRPSIHDYVDFLYWCVVGGIQLPHSSAMFRREVVLALGGYDESLMPSEDLDLLLRLALNRHEARIVEEELIRYRLHERQLSRVHEERQRERAARGHEAFLRALTGDHEVDVEALRLVLAGDRGFFARPGATERALSGVDLLLASAAEQLALSADERAELERRVRAQVLATARAGAWRRGSLPLLHYGLAGGGRDAATGFSRYVAALVLLPVERAVVAVGRPLTSAAFRNPGLRRLGEPARRSRVARRLYAWLTGR